MSEKLTPKQELFCQEYLKDLNATQAAIRAGYSERTANEQASRLLANVKIKQKVQELMNARAERVQVDSDQILKELSRLGYSDVRGLYNEDGTIKHPSEWDDDLARAVASIEVKEEFEDLGSRLVCAECSRKLSRELVGYTKKVKFWPKNHALELMGKHKKLFTDKLEVSATDELAERLMKARKRKGL